MRVMQWSYSFTNYSPATVHSSLAAELIVVRFETALADSQMLARRICLLYLFALFR
jgi:hypothetical protein